MKEYKYPAEYAREKLNYSRTGFYAAIGRGYIRAEGPPGDRYVWLPFKIDPEAEYYTAGMAAEALGYEPNYITMLCRKQNRGMKIKAVMVGNNYRIPDTEVDRIINERMKNK